MRSGSGWCPVIDALVNVLLGWIEAALGVIPDWSLDASFPFLSELAAVNWMVNLVPAYSVVLAALALGPMFLLTTLGLWAYGLLRGGGNRA